MALSSTGQLTLFRAVGRASPLAMNCHARPGGSGIGFVSHGGPFVGLQVRRSSLPPLNPQSAMPPPPSCQELALFHTACCRVRGEAVPALSSTANWLCFAASALAARVTFARPRPRFPTFPTFGFVSHSTLSVPGRHRLSCKALGPGIGFVSHNRPCTRGEAVLCPGSGRQRPSSRGPAPAVPSSRNWVCFSR